MSSKTLNGFYLMFYSYIILDFEFTFQHNDVSIKINTTIFSKSYL
ncbi:hypothetical protein LBBP_04091 [Leptospira borgpetersenii serovar Ballum]|uniref:Uncharacterized protein n=1 Tax=Leptospira borgpetersenii serovar Ballum TaxID=280505 RepID=A0A0S2IX69_LEPBO|nr:hypothetical protein LBBP_04091 [Leptospira borgpetersenii serovar Ballum]